MSPELKEKFNHLERILTSEKGLLIAFSGGIDSSVLLATAERVQKKSGLSKLLAVTADSVFQPTQELDLAKDLAAKLGVHHRVLRVDVLSDQEIKANPPDRCYLCKKTIFSKLIEIAKEEELSVVEGSNVDDDDDYRPGGRAIKELGVLSPLKQAGLSKGEIREIAKDLGLSNWNKPALACLASRIPYDEEITVERLKRVHKAESILFEAGFTQLRVRDHGPIARIELHRDEIHELFDDGEKKLGFEIASKFKALGYQYITVDLEGYRTGALNEVLPEEVRQAEKT